MSTTRFVADGPERFIQGRRADLAMRRARLSRRCRPILHRASFLGRLLIRWRMRRIIGRAMRRGRPSPYSLYGSIGFLPQPPARVAST